MAVEREDGNELAAADELITELRGELAKALAAKLDMTRMLQLALRVLPNRRVLIPAAVVEGHDVKDWTLIRGRDSESGDWTYIVGTNEDVRRGQRLAQIAIEKGLVPKAEEELWR